VPLQQATSSRAYTLGQLWSGLRFEQRVNARQETSAGARVARGKSPSLLDREILTLYSSSGVISHP